MATTSFTEILRTHVDIIKPMLMTDEFCRVYATTARTTRASASKLEYRWAALSFECLQQHMVDGLIEEHEDGELEGWLENWYRNEELHYNNWTRSSSSSSYDFDPHREARERQQQARRNFGAGSSSSDDS